ncbi:MAG: ketose-bisphosphate aldolase [Firmicutes bacterium]|nr:ketose-bisphosphate aldolase [Bacillota bacterium]
MKEILKWATEQNRAVCAFNVTNMELVQAITEAAAESNTPIILQATKGGINYAGLVYLVNLVKSARTVHPRLRVALHLDHGDSFETCKMAIDAGFESVMIDGSHLAFEENIAVTKRVVDYARKFGVTVEGELGQIAGIEDHVSNERSLYTDPAVVRDYVTRTGVDALAISIGTAHGAFKYTSEPQFRFDILEQIHAQIPNTPLVLHGASSVTPSDLATINKFGGKIENARGVSESVLAKSIPGGVRKINIDSDLRLAFTAALRQYFTEKPDHFDPRQYLAVARAHVKELVKRKLSSFSA